MEKFKQLLEQIEAHPAEWVNDGEGLAVLNEAVSCAPPEILETAKRILKHDELMREIFKNDALDPEWIHGEAGSLMLAEALSLAPPEIKAKMETKIRELGLLPEVEFVDDDGNPVFTMEQIAETLGASVEEVRQAVEELNAHVPLGLVPHAAVHRLN